MEDSEEQSEELDVGAEDKQQQQDSISWGKKLVGLQWRIDVPTNADDTDEEDEDRAQPHAVVELEFSSHDVTGKEVFELPIL